MSVCGTKAKPRHLTASERKRRTDRRPGMLHKEIKMYISCCDAEIFEEKEEQNRWIYCIVLTRVRAETSGPVVPQERSEGKESSEVQRSRAVPFP